MLHETPARFGKENSQVIMGYQMALDYTGSTFLPAFLGLVAAHSTLGIFPLFVLLYITFMLIGSEKLNVVMKKSKRSNMFPGEKHVEGADIVAAK